MTIYIRMNDWLHYAKLYAANIRALCFVLIKYKIWIEKNLILFLSFLIEGLNILIAVIVI